MNFVIGKGKHYSIAKAALIFYFESGELEDGQTFDYGNPDYMHHIVDIAGCSHCGPGTSVQVSSRLIGSPYWEARFIEGFYSGLVGRGGASLLKPSQKGRAYYEAHLKNRKKK